MPLVSSSSAASTEGLDRLPLSPCHVPTSHSNTSPPLLNLMGETPGLPKAPLEPGGECGASRSGGMSASNTVELSTRTMAPSRLTVVTPVPSSASPVLDSGELTTPAESEAASGPWSRGSPVEDVAADDAAADGAELLELSREATSTTPTDAQHRPLPSPSSSETLASQDDVARDEADMSEVQANANAAAAPALTVDVSICSPVDAGEEEDLQTEEEAVFALLGLSRHVSMSDEADGAAPSVRQRGAMRIEPSDGFRVPTPGPTSVVTGNKRRAAAMSPEEDFLGEEDASATAHGRRSLGPPTPRPDSGEEWKFICKYAKCGKAYASTDAVRKHCRQRHLEWLRRLGHGCPALYCRWEPA